MRELDDLLEAWDRMHSASQRVETSLPFQMSGAIAELEKARLHMRTSIQRLALLRSKEQEKRDA